MKDRLIYLATGAASLLILSILFKPKIQLCLAPYTNMVYALLIMVGVGIPFAAITLLRVRENPHLLDHLYDLHITRRKEKKRYFPRRAWRGRKHHKKVLNRSKRKRDNSNDFAYPPAAQKEIVEKYWEARKRGEVENRDAWASRYNISGRTLRTYEKAHIAEINGNKT